MTQSIKQIRLRLKTSENIRKITRAVEMVSATKYKNIDPLLVLSRQHFDGLNLILKNVSQELENINNLFLEKKTNVKSICVVVISSETGLCGTYNSNICKLVEKFSREKKLEQKDISIAPVGKKASKYFSSTKLGFLIEKSFLGSNSKFSKGLISDIKDYLTESFINKKFDEIYFAYTSFGGPTKYFPKIEKILPIEINKESSLNYIAEPNFKKFCENFLHVYLKSLIQKFVVESFTSEHSARAISMNMATENTKELIENIVLQMNKTRQANITRELIEITASIEALKS